MSRTTGGALVFALAVTATTVLTGDTVLRSALHDYRVVTVADNLVRPWSIAFLPGGDAVMTRFQPNYCVDSLQYMQ